MKIQQFWFFIFVLVTCVGCYRPAPRQAFEDLKILEGNWTSSEGSKFNENWTIKNDSLLIGLGFSLNNGDTAFKEHLKIYRSGGSVFYAAKIGEHADFVFFKLREAVRQKWIFENPVHDYPNIIEYKLKDMSTLEAKTTNIRGNKAVIFKMKRIVK